MANTGYKAWNTLEEYDTSTGQATGNTKPNVESDPDYVAPVYDTSYCPLPATLEVDRGNTTFFNNLGATITFNVTSNTTWNVTDNVSWMTISGASNTGNDQVSVIVETNETTSQRTGTVTVTTTDGTVSDGFTVTQQAKVVDNISITPTSMDFPFTGGNQIVQVQADSSWTVSSGGVGISPTSGGSGTTNVTITKLQNVNQEIITNYISFTLTNGDDSEVLTITQEGSPFQN